MRRSLPRLKSLLSLKQERAAEVKGLPEVIQAKRFLEQLKQGHPFHEKQVKKWTSSPLVATGHVSKEKVLTALDASFLTFFLHVESRIAALLGAGFYTIGPCGEELLSPIGISLKATDPMALHYRHLAVNLARQMAMQTQDATEAVSEDVLQQIALGRARGYVVATSDPVCGGHHCALGGTPNDFIVTSTLASQTCPAVGRALGGNLARMLGRSAPFGGKDYVSFVSVGDGSTSNGHFLSGLNLAKFAAHRKYRVPLLLCVTDNGLCISLKNHGYFSKKFTKDMGIPAFECEGADMVDIWETVQEASAFVRQKAQPAALIVKNITRRFGHAATDRQLAYLSPDEVKGMQATNDLLVACEQAIEAGYATADELHSRLDLIWKICEEAFALAHEEPKIQEREQVAIHTHKELVLPPQEWTAVPAEDCIIASHGGTSGAKSNVMRKHMNRVFDEKLSTGSSAGVSPSDVVYIGEDVTHGGYYLVTEGLQKKHGGLRIADFPPDETSLIGAGMGYAQSGLTPIVELPYAKYIDCGFDMFTEACIMNWLSQGRQPNGMIFRLQGFGRGVFGGNYHTHNCLYMPPGIDVVCYSNGYDYSCGMRYALHQAKAGRVVMFVDCTELLNLREIAPMRPDDDGVKYRRCVGAWEFEYSEKDRYRTFDDINLYEDDCVTDAELRFAIVAYGGGLIPALQAANELRRRVAEGTLPPVKVDVVDCPLLSSVPRGLSHICSRYDRVLFADLCKEGQHPFASHIAKLRNTPTSNGSDCRAGAFKDANHVRCIASQPTYNPLGTTLTFLSADDILMVAASMI